MADTNRFLRYLGLCIIFVTIAQLHSLTTSSPNNRTSFINDARLALPWYKRPHKTIQSTMTSHLSPLQRAELLDRKILEARDKAHQAFEDTYAGIIPGSIIRTPDQAQALRSLVDCWTRGRWVKVNVVSPIRHFQDPIYNTCDNTFYKTHDRSEPRDAVTYRWEPSCLLPATTIDPKNWCRVIRGRSLALVGDLVHYQMHELLLDVLRDAPTVCYGEMSCRDHTICDTPKEAMLRYVRNDLLSPTNRVDIKKGHPSAAIVDYPFITGFPMKRFKIYILNRAPVVEDDETFIKQLIDSIRTLRMKKPNSLVIYRSTTIGHPFCDDAEGPLQAPLTAAEQQELPYGWSEQKRRNAMAREIVESAGGLYVDLAALTDTRPDGHIGGQDCLRYCMPGPVDAWALILYNVMLGLEGQLPLPEDIQQ